MMFKRKGGGVKGLLNNVKKTALFSHDGFPYQHEQFHHNHCIFGTHII